MFHSRRLVLLIFASANFINCVQCIITFLPQTKTHVNIGDSTTLSCHVTPLTGVIRFVKDGTTVGQCTAPVPGLFPGTCTPSSIVQDIFTENTTWIIPSATFTSLNGSWECSHNTERDSSEIFVTDRATVLQTNEATIPANFDKNTQFQVFVNCSYPQPEITWKLKTCSGTSNIIDVIVNPTVVETSSTCISPRRIYSSSIKVSDMANPQERTCYKATATLSYSYTTSISISSSFSQDIFIDGLHTSTDTLTEKTTTSFQRSNSTTSILSTSSENGIHTYSTNQTSSGLNMNTRDIVIIAVTCASFGIFLTIISFVSLNRGNNRPLSENRQNKQLQQNSITIDHLSQQYSFDLERIYPNEHSTFTYTTSTTTSKQVARCSMSYVFYNGKNVKPDTRPKCHWQEQYKPTGDVYIFYQGRDN